ncbi:MAG: DUF4857 domain-containing protein [Breznakibacter sp.]
MKTIKNYTYWILLLFFTLIGAWLIPFLVKKITVEAEKYPFLYYSSVVKELCIIDYKDKEAPVREINGKTYTTIAQADSILPLFKYRQLLSEGRLPDSINGQAVTVQKIRAKNVVYRFSPSAIGTPQSGLYIMYESMPKRVGFESPGDVFRLDDVIEFVDIESNTVNPEKSKLFKDALLKEGFRFPAQWVNGNMNPRKPYDEGYFVLDAKGQLFHLKMVNGRPFVGNTNAGSKVDVAWFEMLEVADKRFYGFLYDQAGNIYIIGNEGGKYELRRLGIEPLDLKKDQLSILGNMLYWTVTVTTEKGRDYYGLDMETLDRLSEYHVAKTPGRWEKASTWLFPFYFTFEDSNSNYLYPRLHTNGFYGLVSNVFLTLAIVILVKRPGRQKIIGGLWVLVFGLPGMLANLLLPCDKS